MDATELGRANFTPTKKTPTERKVKKNKHSNSNSPFILPRIYDRAEQNMKKKLKIHTSN